MSDKSVTVNEMIVNGVTMVPKDSIKGDIVAVQSGSVGVWEIGKKYFVRAVTYHLVGELVHVTDTELLFKHASWIASSGRFGVALNTGVLSEVEPFVNPVIMGRGAIVDATIWDHALPTKAK